MKSLHLVFCSLIFAACGLAKAQTTEPGGVPEVQAQPATSAQPAPKRLIRVSGGVVAGLKLAGDDPVYPNVDVQGAVVLHAIIGEDGHVQSLAVVSGSPLLAGAALDAVKTWVYKPYLLNGEPTAVDTTIVVNFQR